MTEERREQQNLIEFNSSQGSRLARLERLVQRRLAQHAARHGGSGGDPITDLGAITFSGGLTVTGGATFTAPVGFPDGSVSAPAVYFTSDTDMGFYKIADAQLGLSLGNALTHTFERGVIVVAPSTTATEGGQITLEGEGSYQDWHIDAFFDHLRFVSNGAEKWRVQQDRTMFGQDNGDANIEFTPSAAEPAYSFVGDQGLGLFRVAAGQLGISTGGIQRWSFNATTLSPAVNDSYDIGTTTVGVRDLFVNVVQALNGGGSASVPAFVAQQDTDTGYYFPAVGQAAVSVSGGEVQLWESSGTDFGGGATGDARVVFAPGAATPAFTFVGDENTGFGRFAADQANVMAGGVESIRHTANGVLTENAATALPNFAAVSPSNFNPASASTWETVTSSTTTVWDHNGTNRDVAVRVSAKAVGSYTTATARTVSFRVQVSLDGGSTWTNTSIPTQAVIGNVAGAGQQVPLPVFYLVEGTATGDVQFRLQAWRNGAITNFIQIYAMAEIDGQF